mgnify:CR=1 FL=1
MHPLLFSTFLLPTLIKCTSLVDQTISDLDQSDPRLATFIKDKLLEPPPIFPENVEDMNMEVNIISIGNQNYCFVKKSIMTKKHLEFD